MRKFLFDLLVLVVCVAALGFYRGWFTLEIDQSKMRADIEMVKEKIGGDAQAAQKQEGQNP